MRNFLIVLAFLLSFSFLAASVYIIITQPANQTAWGWLMACGFMLGIATVNSID